MKNIQFDAVGIFEYSTNILAKNDIKSIVICGLSTSCAVLRTAVPASDDVDDGFIVSVSV
jgi:nicotinamidase-related amidase